MLFPHTAAGRAEKSNPFLRQRHRVIHKAAGLAFKYNGNTIRAGVGAHNAAQLEHQQTAGFLGLFKWEKLGITYSLDGVQPPSEEAVQRAEELLCIKDYPDFKK